MIVPTTAGFAIPRATTAACEVIPPLTVRTPAAAFKPTISSEDVSTCTRITGIFLAARSFATS